MLFTPLRRAPMMLGGVGFQAGLDEARRKSVAAAQPQPAACPDVVAQLMDLKALLDAGHLTPAEFEVAKRKVLDG
jgi:hypothetical protein